MSRYIDASGIPINTSFWSEIGKLIDEAPSIDIVFCKECKYADVCSQNVAMRETYDIYEKIDFCSRGEREGE